MKMKINKNMNSKHLHVILIYVTTLLHHIKTMQIYTINQCLPSSYLLKTCQEIISLQFYKFLNRGGAVCQLHIYEYNVVCVGLF